MQLSPRQFREKNEALLAEEICGRQSIPEIRRLARSYVTILMATGFSQKHIEEVTLDFFHYGSDRIGSSTAILDFLHCFPYEMGEFTVVFRVDQIFEHLTEALTQVGLTITNNLPRNFDASTFHSFATNGAEKLFAVVPKLAAHDIYSARAAAEKSLKLGATLLTLFHHKEHPSWRPECIVIDEKKQQSKLISKPINAMHKCADLKQPVASNRLQLFMNDFSLDRDSFSKFVRSAQLHSMALTSNAEENQILNLWISLESLIPSETKSADVSNIEHIVASLLPFLNVSYFERLLNNLVKDLLRWNSTFVKTILRPIPGKRTSNRLAKLLALPQFSAARSTLESQLRDFHLLRDRVDHFRDILSCPSKVTSALDAHKIRLEWQIRRIYRTRNIIVHSGNTPTYTHLLIAHTHDYLDTVLSTLVGLASKPKMINSVGQGFKYIGIKYSMYYKNLSEKGIVFDMDNIDSLLFS